MGLSSNWSIRSRGIYLSGLSWKIWRYQSVKWDWNLYVGIISPQALKSFIYSALESAVIIVLYMLWWWLVSWYLLSASLIPLASVYSRGTRYPPRGLLWPHHRGQCLKNLNQWQTCCMRNKAHERLWPPLLKLKFGNSWLTSQCCGSSCKNSIPVFNSNSNSNSRGFNSNSIFNSTNFNSNSNSNSGIGIGIELQFQFRNWIDPNPGRSLLIFSDVAFKMAAWRPYWIFWFPD